MILHDHVPYDLDVRRPLPGVAPLGLSEWLLADEVFAAQMALRETLLGARRSDVVAALPGSAAALEELLDLVTEWLPEGFSVSEERVRRPDGVDVVLDRADPLDTLGRLVQEDFCLLEKAPDEDEHRLTAAVLCFPSAWTLGEKLGRPLRAIHGPVNAYDDAVGRRVQRLFNGLQPGRPLWRWNVLASETPGLHNPMTEEEAAGRELRPKAAGFLRSERQVLVRLPKTRAVVFSIHTFLTAAG